MAQVEFGIISIVGKNVVESELKLHLPLFSILTHTDYSQNYSGIIRASLVQWSSPANGDTPVNTVCCNHATVLCNQKPNSAYHMVND